MTEFTTVQPNSLVSGAYNRARDIKTTASDPADQINSPQGQDFSQMLQKTAEDAVETVRTGDAAATAGLIGKADMQQVVEATMAMESTVRVSVAVRDKLVEAYQEIMRMPI